MKVTSGKKLLQDFLKKLDEESLSCGMYSPRDNPMLVDFRRWPSMQGQGIEAAGAVEAVWGKLLKFATKNGITILRHGERRD